MGMHFGIVAARVPLAQLTETFRACGTELIDRGSLRSLEEAPGDRSATYVIAGECDGASYLMDESMLLSAAVPDRLAEVARTVQACVVSCGR